MSGNCLDTCRFASGFDCHGECRKIDTEEEGVSYDVDEFSTEHRSPNMTILGDKPALNGGW